MNIPGKEKSIFLTQVPSAFRRKHVVFLPKIYWNREICFFLTGVIFKLGCLDKYRVRVHVHIFPELKKSQWVGIGTMDALDNLSVGTAH